MNKTKINLFQIYLDNAIVFDLVFVSIITLLYYYINQSIGISFSFLNPPNIEKFSSSLIAVSSTLLGFLLTIITVIITFKRSYSKSVNQNGEETISDDQNEEETIFDDPDKKKIFYNDSELSNNVIKVFSQGTYEIALVLIVLLVFEFNYCFVLIEMVGIIYLSLLILIFFTLLRCLHIFKLFLNVHS